MQEDAAEAPDVPPANPAEAEAEGSAVNNVLSHVLGNDQDAAADIDGAVTALKERQKLLLEISNGADHPFSRLSKLEGDYNQAIQTYTQNGRKLQQIWSRVFQ